MIKTTDCVRCGQAAFAILKIEAMVGQTRLKVSEDAGLGATCSVA